MYAAGAKQAKRLDDLVDRALLSDLQDLDSHFAVVMTAALARLQKLLSGLSVKYLAQSCRSCQK